MFQKVCVKSSDHCAFATLNYSLSPGRVCLEKSILAFEPNESEKRKTELNNQSLDFKLRSDRADILKARR